MLCTTSRARKVVVGLTLVALIDAAINIACWRLLVTYVTIYINIVLLRVVVPVAVLIINAIVVREVRRRASGDAASNLGIQHHQSTSSNSAVPTIMLVATSLIYVLLNGVISVVFMAFWVPQFNVSDEFHVIAMHPWRLVYVYNFYVYLITGKQFRSELHKLFCGRCRSSSSAAVVANDDVQLATRG